MARQSRSSHRDTISVGLLALLAIAGASRAVARLTPTEQIIVAVLAVAGILLIGWSIVGLLQRRERKRLLLANARSLSPADFERRVHILLQDLGWTQLEHVGGTGDRGVDLRGTYQQRRYIVQCKRFKGLVGPQYVRDLEGTRQHEGATCALLVTTGHFGPSSYEWAREAARALGWGYASSPHA